MTEVPEKPEMYYARWMKHLTYHRDRVTWTEGCEFCDSDRKEVVLARNHAERSAGQQGGSHE